MPALVVVGLVAGLLATTGGTGAAQSPLCFGRAATIVAQPGVQTVGTPGSDVIVGTAGVDIIRGRGGDDYICSLAGADVVFGNAGADRIKAGAGADVVHGGKGPDVIIGNSGADTLNGNSGADVIDGRKGGDTISGGSGGDVLAGNGGQDTIRGGRGNDEIRGGSKADSLSGNSGNDVIRGGSAVDTCAGGRGNHDELYSCNDRDPFVGKRSGIDVDGSFQTIDVVSTGTRTYDVVLADTGNGSCGVDDEGNRLFGSVSTGTAVSVGDVLVFDYTRTCLGGDRPDLDVTGRRFTLMPDASLVNDADGAVFA